MAAKIKIQIDAKNAQEAVKKLRGEIDKLDKTVKKPRNLATASGGSHTRAGGSAAKTVGAAVGGGVVGGMAGSVIDRLVNLLAPFLASFARLTTGITDFNSRLAAYTQAFETYANPAKSALTRGQQLDELDDARRMHRTGSVAEEFAWQEAIKNASGAGTQIVDRIMSAIQSAAGGDATAQKNLMALGFTGKDFEGKNDYEAAMMVLEKFAAIRGGENEKEDPANPASGPGRWTTPAEATHALQQIVGVRQFGAAEKLVDVLGDTRQMQRELQANFEQRMPEAQTQQALAATGQAEFLQSIAKAINMAVPENAIKDIVQGGRIDVNAANLAYGAQSGELEPIKKAFLNDIDSMASAAYNNNSRAKWLMDFAGFRPMGAEDGGSGGLTLLGLATSTQKTINAVNTMANTVNKLGDGMQGGGSQWSGAGMGTADVTQLNSVNRQQLEAQRQTNTLLQNMNSNMRNNSGSTTPTFQ